jgi:hypothetical protein
MVVTLNVTVTTAGTPVQVSTTRIPANWVNFMGAIANLGNTYFGDSNVSSTRGQALGSGGGSGSPQFPPSSDTSPYNLADMWVDAANDNDIVQVTYLRR